MQVDGFTVIMPTFNQAHYIKKAILSLLRQTFHDWELIIVNDGCSDNTEDVVLEFLSDYRITYIKNDINQGIGAAINQALDIAKYNHISYLPSDDYYYSSHLQSLKNTFDEDDSIIMAFSGVQFSTSDTLTVYQRKTETRTIKYNTSLQLVQTAHRKTADRWIERSQMISDDLFYSFWNKLITKGKVVPTMVVTANWTEHPFQRHKICNENTSGGIYRYKSIYKTTGPLRIRMSKEKIVSEEEMYSPLKEINTKNSSDLKVLLMGVLSYNPERICSLEENGCRLYGLWKPNAAYNFETVGPFPFGHVQDIEYDKFDDNWIERVRNIAPDIIYANACYTCIDFLYEVMMRLWKDGLHIPYAFHFKEGPQACISKGTFNKYIFLYKNADLPIFLNRLTLNWYLQFASLNAEPLIMDLDLPKNNYFTSDFSEKLSAKDGEVHTLISGRMLGFKNSDLKNLVKNKIHIHVYSETFIIAKEQMLRNIALNAPEYFHLHPRCNIKDWVREFSQYDAGWLHCYDCNNFGDISRLSWDDLNLPNRLSTYAAAGLPMIFPENPGHISAVKEMLERMGIGVFFTSIRELASKLYDRKIMQEVNDNVLKHRKEFTFDYYAPELVGKFKEITKEE